MERMITKMAALCVLTLALAAEAALLTPASLHPLALWGGSHSQGDGLLYNTDMTDLLDGNPATVWRSYNTGSNNPCPTLTSPAPFVVQSVTIVAADVNTDRAGGDIQVMPVGSATYVSTGLTVPSTLLAGETWTGILPVEYQIPLSGIRHNGGYHVEMGDLQFYGCAVGGGALREITDAGTVATAPGSENPAGSLTNGVLENDASGYHVGNGTDHKIVISFGTAAQKVAYVAINPNAYWKFFEVESVGTNGPLNLNALTAYSGWATSSYGGVGGADNPGHSWVILPLGDGSGIPLTAAGILSTDYWGDLSEIVVLAVPEPASLALFAAAGLALIRRRRG